MKLSNKNYIVGIDIGGSKIIAALVQDANIFYKIKIPMPKNKKDFFGKLEKVIGGLIKKAGGKKNIGGIGCGVAGVLDLEKGTVLGAVNIKILNGFNIKNWMQKKFGREVKIDNDARSFLRAEYMFGAGRGYKNLVGVTLGTGIGGGVIIGGKFFYGSFNSAGEVGHMIYSEKKEFEDLVSSKSLKKSGFNSSLAAYQSAKSGNKKAKEVFKKLGEYLGIGIANIINILDPEVVIIGGGLTGASEFFLPQAKETMKKYIISPKSRKNVKIIAGQFGENSGAIGAAALFYSQNI